MTIKYIKDLKEELVSNAIAIIVNAIQKYPSEDGILAVRALRKELPNDIQKVFKEILEELKEEIKKEEKNAKTWFTNQGKTPKARHDQWTLAEFHNGGLREVISKIDKIIKDL